MVKVGVDRIGFYTPRYYLDLKTLAVERGIDPDKFLHGLGQHKMSLLPPGEDIVTMAATAAKRILTKEDIDAIDTVLFATESSFDYSKAAGLYVHKLLNLAPHCRVVELKQACYAATAGMQMALVMIRQNPKRKVLLLASDVARYQLNSAAESSQGAAAIALLFSANPRMLAIEPEQAFYAEDAMDFWRPYYKSEALVDGKYSCDLYLHVLEKVWQRYTELSRRDYQDHDYFCYHVSVPKLVVQAHRVLAKYNHARISKPVAEEQLAASLKYCRDSGNCYTASLYIAVLSLLEIIDHDLTGKRIGLYSYGSGCVGEFFSAVVQDSYSSVTDVTYHQEMLSNREELDYAQYETFYNFRLPIDGGEYNLPHYEVGDFRLTAVSNHKRIYEPV
jgi:hydroxymethylglutaryl-CoA synthase